MKKDFVRAGYKRNVSGTKFLKVFEKEMKKNGNSTFCYGAAKYTDTFSTKKSIMKEREKLIKRFRKVFSWI